MNLHIDGFDIQAQPGQTLVDLVKLLRLEGKTLSTQPLVARIAGEVFTLNYVPVRHKDADSDRPSMRRAMAASKGEIRLLRYNDPKGKEAYVRTVQFVVFLALRQLWPEAKAKMNCTLGSSVYIAVNGAEDFSAERLKAQVQKLIDSRIPLLRRRVPLQQALERYIREGQDDKARLLKWRTVD